MRLLATLGLLALALLATARLAAQPAQSPYTPEETGVMVRVWETIRGAARYEDIDWQAIGIASEPGSPEARRLMAEQWRTLRGAAKFTDINWYAAGFGTPPPAATTAATTSGDGASSSGSPAPAATAAAIEGTWSGTLQSYPSFLRLTLEVPAAASANTAVQATLRSDGGLGRQGGPSGQAPVTVLFDPAARALTITLGREVTALRLRPRTLRGFLDTRNETIAGVIENAPGDSSPYFVLARPRAADERIFEPLDAALGQPGAPGPLGTLRQLRGGTDLEDLQRWARKFVDEYPEVDAYRTESGQLFTMARNLFADAHFEAHFGTTFDAMSAGERQRVMMGLRNAPAPQGNTSTDRTNGVLRAVERAFLPMTGTYTASDMVLSTIAIRHLTAWRGGMLTELAGSGETLAAFRTAAAVDAASGRLAPYLWPSERTELSTAAAASLERAARAPLVAEVDALLGNAQGLAGARAIDAALELRPAAPQSALERAAGQSRRGPIVTPAGATPATSEAVSLAELARWAPDTWAAQQPRLNAGLDALLTQLLAGPRSTLGLTAGGAAPAANPTERLARSKAWYDGNRELVEGFASRGVVAEFLNDLAAQREADFAAALPALSSRLAATSSPAEAQSLGRELVVDLDLGRSRSWQTFERQRTERLQALDRAAFVARVGNGPFGPDYPGAAYLNALYRNDTARLDAEDRAVAEPMARTMEQLYAGSGIDALASLFSGGAIPQGGLTQMIAAETRRYTIARALTGFFIVAYERVYPACMDPDPVVFEETTVWETVVTNGFGTEISRYPSHSTTTTYNINQRHAPAFRKIGAGGSAEGIDFTTTLFGAFLPRELTDSLREVSAALRGLRIAMTDNGCDSDVITMLEKNMLARAMAR